MSVYSVEAPKQDVGLLIGLLDAVRRRFFVWAVCRCCC